MLAGSENGLWLDCQKLGHEVLAHRQPQLDVAYTEIPGYGHPDTFLGRGAALDMFGHIFDFLGKRRRRTSSGAAGCSTRAYPDHTPGGNDPCRSSLSTAQH
ncbi:hypothetical protein ACFYXH_21875 [Streptomyces sp. NPDC002730]|uniref:hypothetical protein n=1 Tax=Streptomyces sp. NPDC002730 TaxID=3364662 RepID=UPI0036B26748